MTSGKTMIFRRIQSPRGWIFSAANRIIKTGKLAARFRLRPQGA
jgi:hypothetical protein